MIICLRSTLIIMKTSLTMKDTRDMTQGNPYKLMIGFAMPILLSQVFQQLYLYAFYCDIQILLHKKTVRFLI